MSKLIVAEAATNTLLVRPSTSLCFRLVDADDHNYVRLQVPIIIICCGTREYRSQIWSLRAREHRH